MSFRRPADGVVFANDDLEEGFNNLPENSWLKKAVLKAIHDFKENAFCRERIKRELIPKEYKQDYHIDNLLWYPLPNGWRLVYSIISSDNKITAVIVEYFDHKDYERRFNY